MIVVADPIANRQNILIPQGHCWLTGDNLSNSTDSRYYGPVPLAMIKGKVKYKVWPQFVKIENGLETEFTDFVV